MHDQIANGNTKTVFCLDCGLTEAVKEHSNIAVDAAKVFTTAKAN